MDLGVGRANKWVMGKKAREMGGPSALPPKGLWRERDGPERKAILLMDRCMADPPVAVALSVTEIGG